MATVTLETGREMIRVRGKVGADRRDHVLIVLATTQVNLDIKVKAVNKGVAKGPLHSRVARVSVRVP